MKEMGQHNMRTTVYALCSIITAQTVVHVALSLDCHPAEYFTGKECCPKCDPGTRVKKHCTEFKSTSCFPCDGGTFMSQPTGLDHCLACRICDSGSGLKEKTPCSSTSNTVCEPQEAFFCTSAPEEGSCVSAQRHRRCEPGQFIQRPGTASADTDCSSCPEGTFSNGTLSRCEGHTQCELLDKVTVKEGSSQSDAECGEKNNNTIITGTVVAGALVGALLLTIGVVVVVYRKMRKRPDNAVL